MRKKADRGEVITVVTVAAVVFLSLATLVSTALLKNNKITTQSRAASPGTCRDNPESAPAGYTWKADCNKQCNNNADCPQNTNEPSNVNPATSNWCYGFEGPNHSTADWRCLMLVSGSGGTNPQPTSPPSGGNNPQPTSPPAGGNPGTQPGMVNNGCYNFGAEFEARDEGGKKAFYATVNFRGGPNGDVQLNGNGVGPNNHLAGWDRYLGNQTYDSRWTQSWSSGNSAAVATFEQGRTINLTYTGMLSNCSPQSQSVSCALSFDASGAHVSGTGCSCKSGCNAPAAQPTSPPANPTSPPSGGTTGARCDSVANRKCVNSAGVDCINAPINGSVVWNGASGNKFSDCGTNQYCCQLPASSSASQTCAIPGKRDCFVTETSCTSNAGYTVVPRPAGGWSDCTSAAPFCCQAPASSGASATPVAAGPQTCTISDKRVCLGSEAICLAGGSNFKVIPPPAAGWSEPECRGGAAVCCDFSGSASGSSGTTTVTPTPECGMPDGKACDDGESYSCKNPGQYHPMSVSGDMMCKSECTYDKGVCNTSIAYQTDASPLPYWCRGMDKCYGIVEFSARIASCSVYYDCPEGIGFFGQNKVACLKSYLATDPRAKQNRRCTFVTLSSTLCCWP